MDREDGKRRWIREGMVELMEDVEVARVEESVLPVKESIPYEEGDD